MLIVDAHLDLSMNALQWNRDLLRSAYTIRTMEQTVPGKGRAQGTVAYPEMRRGRIFLSVATLIARSTGKPAPHIDYATEAQAYGMAHGQLAYYRALEQQGHVRILTDTAALEAHVAEWQAWDAAHTELTEETPPLGFVISMEGADPILWPEQLGEWKAAGLRLLGPTHYGTGRYAGGTATELGLTEIGVRLLQEMDRLGVLLDLTHCSDQSFWQALEHYHGPVLASHNNCRALVPHQRQFSDAQLQAIFERDGVVGVALDTWMLLPGWVVGQSTNEQAPLAKVVDHIDHMCQLAGNCRHVGIGTDLDGGYGREQSPVDLDTIADLQHLTDLLSRRGYADADIRAIMHGNWLRLLGVALAK
ncbi:MAG: membrane dipeptidase [Caldilineaceae bacterium]|nr:membrane dipeptidase [Caldilineaceae bacterium]